MSDGEADPLGEIGLGAGQSPLVSVVVVNFNGGELTRECLACLRRQTYPNREIIVVDNGSSDGSVDLVRQAFPEARLVALTENRGFAGGCNAGIRAATEQLIATINNDAFAEPTWLEEMVRVALRDPRVGMVASKLLLAHRPTTIDAAGVCLDRVGIAWDRNNGLADNPAETDQELFGPCAAAALYARRLFDDVDGFDESFFCYLEDVDLAWRARLAGWRCVYAPRARALHRHSATAGENSRFKRYQLGRNKVWMIAKNYPSPAIWLYLPFILAYDLTGLLIAILVNGGSPADRLAGLAGRAAGLVTLPSVIARRREEVRPRRLTGGQALSVLDPPRWPWLLLRQRARLRKVAAPVKPSS